MKMRALYSKDFDGNNLKESLPHIFKDDNKISYDDLPAKKLNFAAKYDKL